LEVIMDRIPVGVLGATGTVGQRFIQLLEAHPWFEVRVVAASGRSAGQRYAEACHWLLPTPLSEAVAGLTVQPIEPDLDCRLVFSALPSSVARPVEEGFAQAGYVVCTNAAPHRMDKDVPLLIPEVNPDHTILIDTQQQNREWKGLIVASANCTTTQLALGLKPLEHAFGLKAVFVATMQAISGAGYPGVPSPDILGNVVPYIGGEEEKVEDELLKLLGSCGDSQVVPASITVSAHCNRVPVRDGHTECLSIEFEKKPTPADVIHALESFRGPKYVSDLPSSPTRPISVRREPDRPQPIRDINEGQGMSIVIGRVRPCPIFHCRLVLLGHNTVRGAAGGSIHNAELLVKQGWIE
jgi:aspartate-semialdehyde dehydrogenase